ncbi:MAG: hypothetical protein IJY41_02470 [Clostridia bacterium]|nr:hypothetical protein [Clostridia bacterium]
MNNNDKRELSRACRSYQRSGKAGRITTLVMNYIFGIGALALEAIGKLKLSSSVGVGIALIALAVVIGIVTAKTSISTAIAAGIARSNEAIMDKLSEYERVDSLKRVDKKVIIFSILLPIFMVAAAVVILILV